MAHKNIPQRASDKNKTRTLGEFLVDRENPKEQNGYALVVEPSGYTRQRVVRAELREQGVKYVHLVDNYSDVMRLMTKESKVIEKFLGKEIKDIQTETTLHCRLIFISVTDIAGAPRAIETVKELRSHPRFRGAVIVIDFPSQESLREEEQDKYGQLIALAKEANIEASVVSQSSQIVTGMFKAALDYINEKQNDTIYKKLIGIGESILERKVPDPDLALSTFQFSRIQELLFLINGISAEFKRKGHPSIDPNLTSEIKRAMIIVNDIQGNKGISKDDRAEGFREAIDILKTVLLELREKHTVKTKTKNTFGPRRLVGEGRAYQLKKEYKKAEDFFQLALQMMDGKFINALIALSELYNEINNKEKEINSLEQAIKINPNNIHRLTAAAGLHVESGNKERAQELAEDALKIDPEVAAKPAAEIYLELGDDEKAQALFTESLSREGVSSEDQFHTLNRRAIALRKQGKYQEAIKDFKEALRIDPEDAAIYYNIGVVYNQQGKKEEASSYFEKALNHDPTLTEAKEALEKLKANK